MATATKIVSIGLRSVDHSLRLLLPIGTWRCAEVIPFFAFPPAVRRVQIHQLLSDETFKRYRWNFMRLHYQFVMGNEVRAPYDYFMLVCGPAPFWDTISAPNGGPTLNTRGSRPPPRSMTV